VFEIQNYLDYQYLITLNKIKEQGVTKGDRTGVGTRSLFGTSIRVDMRDGFPLLTSKKVYTKAVIVELLWFLGKHMEDPAYSQLGRTNIRYLLDNKCNIWVGDAYKKYKSEWIQLNSVGGLYDHNIKPFTEEEFIHAIRTNDSFAELYGNLGAVYGQQWREWFVDNLEPVDQIANVIQTLRSNPDSRRIMVNAWNVADLDDMILPPCHYAFQFWTRELTISEKDEWRKSNDGQLIPKRAISLMWNQRSADFPLGVPFNIASYGFLLHMVAKVVNMIPQDLLGVFGDSHIYTNQVDQVDIQSANETFELPTLEFKEKEYKSLTDFDIEDFIIKDYNNAGRVDYPLSN
jgi:thymidylate synthase